VSGTEQQAIETAREYYNSDDADNFYHIVWGGEDIHIGLYASSDEPIRLASARTVERMRALLPPMDANTRVLDLGAGYGGAARNNVLATGCHVTCLSLSEKENERNREKNAALSLEDRVEVIDGPFEAIPAEDGAFDVVWSEDAFLHSADRAKVLSEAARVLKPGGHLIFTDPMQADDCPDGVLQPVYDRIHLDSLASFGYYRETAKGCGFAEVAIEDHTPQLTAHYTRVRDELMGSREDLAGHVSDAYVERMLQGLQHWIDAGSQGYLAWGILHFQKPS
jgi:sarcosine/dimethylglycine N-methyltransferase